MSAGAFHRGLKYPKARPKLLDKQECALKLARLDRAERKRCRERSGGRCEVRELYAGSLVPYRCTERATENHHLIGGIGRRNRGRSILAEHRLDVCSNCHSEITNHVLQPVGTPEDRETAATVRYIRIR